MSYVHKIHCLDRRKINNPWINHTKCGSSTNPDINKVLLTEDVEEVTCSACLRFIYPERRLNKKSKIKSVKIGDNTAKGYKEMSELSFLIDLLLNHELPKPTKDLIAARIRDVELALQTPRPQTMPVGMGGSIYSPTKGRWEDLTPPQAPSTVALMAKHGDLPIVPPEQIAQTPITQAAVAAREAIMQGKIPDRVSTGKGTQGPKKW